MQASAPPSALTTQNLRVMTMVVQQCPPFSSGSGVDVTEPQQRDLPSSTSPRGSLYFLLANYYLGTGQLPQQTASADTRSVTHNANDPLAAPTEAASPPSQHSHQSQGGLLSFPREGNGPGIGFAGPPTTTGGDRGTAVQYRRSDLGYPTVNPTLDQISGPPPGITQEMSVHHRGTATYSPDRNITPTFGSPPYIMGDTIPGVSQRSMYYAPPGYDPTTAVGLTPDLPLTRATRMDLRGFTGVNRRLQRLQDKTSSLASSPFSRGGDSALSTVPSNPIGGSTFPPPIPGLPSQPLAPSQRSSVNSPTPHTDLNHTIHGRGTATPTTAPPVSVFTAEMSSGQSNEHEQYAGGAPLSPTSPVPSSSGWNRQHSRHPNTFGQDVPQMLGEMKDVIANLAASVNGLKDAVSDLRTRQSPPTGLGSVPVRRSEKGKGRARRDGGISDSGEPRDGVGVGDRVDDDSVADDEGEVDEDEVDDNSEQGIVRIRVGVVACIPRLYS